MNQYERRFYEDIHKIVIIQEKILKELQEMNKPIIEVKEAPKKIEKLELESGKIDDKEFLAKYITHNRYKINELIDEVNKLKESE